MDLERIRRQLKREGVSFPRMGLGSIPVVANADTTGRVLARSGASKIVIEYGYDRYYTTHGVMAERTDELLRGSTANRFISEVSALVAPNIRSKWESVLTRMWNTSASGQRVIAAIESFDGDSEESLIGAIIRESMILGARIEEYDAIEQVRGLIPEAKFKPEIEEVVRDSLDMMSFTDLSQVVVPMPDISIADIMNENTWKNISPTRLLELFMGAALARRRVDLNSIFPEDYTFARTYPQTTMLALHDASFVINQGFSLDAQGMKRIKKDPEFAVAQRGMARFAQRMTDIKGLFSSVLLDPSSEHFPVLREVVIRYLRGERDEVIILLHKLGLNETSTIVNSYRRARQLMMMGYDDREFFGLFAESVGDIVEEGRLAEAFYIPTRDDLVDILVDEGESTPLSKSKALAVLAAKISSIFSRKSIPPEHNFEIESLRWGNLVPPQEASLRFQPRPHRFSIQLTWTSDVGESLVIGLNFDTKAGKFDWNFLEAPEDSSMVAMRNASFAVAQSMLQKIETDINVQFEQRQKQKIELAKQGIALKRGVKRERSEDDIYALRKDVKREARNARPVPTQIDSLASHMEIKKLILLPEEDKLKSMLAALGSVDQGIVRKAIDDFNQKGIGRLSRKRSRAEDGEPLYTLAVGCTAPKGVRVLVKESSSSAGFRKFEIIDIRYRKDIYRKAGI